MTSFDQGRHAAPVPPRPRRQLSPVSSRLRPHAQTPPAWWQNLRRALSTPWPWLLVWLLSRWWMFRTWHAKYQFINSDVNYYRWWLSSGRGIREMLVEYPQPVVWFLDGLRLLGSSEKGYLLAFGLAMAALDAAFTYLLWRRGTLRAMLFWIVFVHFFGALIWFRYDMLPAFVVGVAALVVSRHPAVSGALVALGGGLKLWPAMLIAPLAGRSRPALVRMLAFGLTGLALAGLAYLQAGWDRLVSPLTWQSDRGLQAESVPATWLMWLRVHRPLSWKVEMSKYNAFEVFGPGIEGWMAFSDWVMVAVIASAAGMAVVTMLRRQLPADLLALCMVSIVLGMIVANKTLSPQYLLWLGTPVAALVATAQTPRMRHRALALAAGSLVLAFLTQQVYPVWYGHIIGPTPQMEATAMLAGRNLMLVVMMIAASIWAWDDLTADGLGSPRSLR